jgi:hypothetical protein
LGKQAEVFDAEFEKALLAANRCYMIICTLNNKPTSIYVFLNNQAAIQRIGTTSPGPGQIVAIDIAQIACSLQEMGIELHICWVPAHLSVPGNETSDQLTNKATQMKQPQPTTTALTHWRRNFRAQQLANGRQHWVTSKHGKQYINNSNNHWPKMKLDPSYSNTFRQTVFQLLSLWKGHGFFKSYLKKIKAKDITCCKCNCGHPNQTVDHLLL